MKQRQFLKSIGQNAAVMSMLAFAVFTLLMGCSPKLKDRDYESPQLGNPPRNADTKLELGTDPFREKPDERWAWLGRMNSSTFFGMIEEIYQFGADQGSPEMIRLGKHLVNRYYNSAGATGTVKFSQSPYISAAIGETQDSSRKDLRDAVVMLQKDQATLEQLIVKSQKEFPWPTKAPLPLRAERDVLKSYIDFLMGKAEQADIDPRTLGGLKGRVSARLDPIYKVFDSHADQIEKAKNMVEVVAAIKDLADKSGFKFSPEQDSLLNFGDVVGKDIEAIANEQHVLTILINIWERMTPEERDLYFNERAKELNDFLKGANQSRRDCLKNPKCTGLVVGVVRQKVSKKIQEIGLKQVQSELRTACLVNAQQAVVSGFSGFVRQLPTFLIGELKSGIGDFIAFLQGAEKDFVGFIQRAGIRWANQYFGLDQYLATLESDSMELDWNAKDIQVKAIPRGTSGPLLSRTLGSSLAMQISTWNFEAQDPMLGKRILEQLNKLLVMGGHRQKDGSLFPAYTVALFDDKPLESRMDLRMLLKENKAFYIPDRVYLKSEYDRRDDIVDLNVSAQSQSELLRGTSKFLRYLKDWEINSFDKTLGKIKISDLITELHTLDLEKSLFPKDMLYPLALGNAANILTNLTKPSSPMFILSSSGDVKWGDENFGSFSKSAFWAGFVNLNVKKRQMTVWSQDLSRWILALSEFYNAVDGVERSQSSLLRERGPSGRTALEDILEARTQVKNLVLGLSNFLTARLRDQHGSVISKVELDQLDAPPSLAGTFLDQLLAIEALMAANKVLGASLYTSTFIDAYYALNSRYYKTNLGFYSDLPSNQVLPSVSTRLRAIRILSNLAPMLPESSEKQLHNLLNPWIQSLKSRKLNE